MRSSEVSPVTIERVTFEELNKFAPLQGDTIVPTGGDPESDAERASFVYREPVLNREERIAGYQFSLHRRLHSRFAASRNKVRRVYDDLLVRSLTSFDLAGLLGHRIAFIDLAVISLDNPQLANLAPSNTVLLLDIGPGAVGSPEQIAAQIAAVRKLNFGVTCRLRPETVSYLPEVAGAADFLQLRASEFSARDMAQMVRQARSCARRIATPLCTMAADLVAFDDFQICLGAGFDFFQGEFITSRHSWHTPQIDSRSAKILAWFEELAEGADSAKLANTMSVERDLVGRVMRFANSPIGDLKPKAGGLEEAIERLGPPSFARLLLLLLFDAREPGGPHNALLERVLSRARLLEQLGVRAKRDEEFVESLFACGALSLVDQAVSLAPDELFDRLSVGDDIREAIGEAAGALGDFLQLARACESGESAQVGEFAARCSLALDLVNDELLQALLWAQDVTSQLES